MAVGVTLHQGAVGWSAVCDCGISCSYSLTFWHCTNCKAECGLCSGAVLNIHKAVHFDNVWVHNECSHITEVQYETLQNPNRTCICSKCDFFFL